MKIRKTGKYLAFLLCAAVLLTTMVGATPAVSAKDIARAPEHVVASATPKDTSEEDDIPVGHRATWKKAPGDKDAKNKTTDGDSTASDIGKSKTDPLPEALIPGGMAFGVSFTTDGVLVVGLCEIETENGKRSPAKTAGVQVGDLIMRLDDHVVTDATTLTSLIEAKGAESYTLTVTRQEKTLTFTITPAHSKTDDKYKSGIWVRDGGAGIGTVTFIEPDTGIFAGLGHGICDAESGKLLPMHRGQVMDVTISGIVRGQAGAPGELKGYLGAGKLGSVFSNTECGVFGLYSKLPDGCETPIPVAERAEIREGEAELLCALDTGTVSHYKVMISAIDRNATSNKCFTVSVIDPALLEKTSGIVQGMSGSPLIQNGKLIGAVTHVLISDPSVGYGIFIDNMLSNLPD